MTKEQIIARNMKNTFSDAWYPIKSGMIYTLDQTDFKQPVKLFPPRENLEFLTRDWETHRLVLYPKSRRMMLSWLMTYLHLWLAMFHPGRSVFLVSDKAEKSFELLDRCEFIYNNIPEDALMKPLMKRKQDMIEFPGLDSYIKGIPSGADQLRQYTASALMFDEFAFWKDAQETLSAAHPCVEGGGRITIISSALDGPFKRIVFDQALV